jgi:hypothetical protein
MAVVRRHVGPLVDAALETGAGHRTDGRVATGRDVTAGAGGEEPGGIAVRAPVVAQEREGVVRKRDVAILGALAVDVEQRAVAIDIRHLEADTLHEPEPAGVNGGEADAVDSDPHRVEHPPHFVAAQDDGELVLALGTCDVEDGPRPPEGLPIEELDAAEGNGVGAARHLLDGAQVEQVLPDLLFTELVGGGLIEAGQLSDRVDVGLDRAVGVAAELEVLDHALAERCHVVLSDEGVRGSDTAPLSFSIARQGECATDGQCYPPQAD